MNDTLSQSYRWCQTVCRQSGSSFYGSFRLLHAARRQSMYAVYAFARITDDLCDDVTPDRHDQPHSLQMRRQQLDGWKNRLIVTLAEEHGSRAPTKTNCVDSTELLWPALRDTAERYAIPAIWFERVVDGVVMDLDQTVIESWEDLEEYCFHVASAVGILCTYIWRQSGSRIPDEAARACGIAFQLTNILRDIFEDSRMGRVYVPQSLLVKYEVDRAAWLQGVPNGNWQGLIDEMIQVAETYYCSGWSTIEALTPDSQRMFSLIWRGYRALLWRIANRKSQLWQSTCVSLPRHQKVRLAACHAFPPLYHLLKSPCPEFPAEA